MARRLSRDDIISNVYYNLETGFGSINETLKKAKEQDQTINRVDVENFMRKQPNKQIRKYRGSNSYTAPFARFEYQIDIMDIRNPLPKNQRRKFPSRTTNRDTGWWSLTSSASWQTSSLKEKSGPITLSAMKESFNKMGFPMSVYSDNDRAFQAGVKDFFEKEGITHVVTLTHANVVERFIRTMKNMIHDRVRFNRGSWTVMLSKALDKYNDTIHSSTKMKPKDAHDDKNHMNVRVSLTRREKNTRKYPDVKVIYGEGLWEEKNNYTERKEYNSKWSNQSYKIVKIEYDDVGNRTFKLEGLNKPNYPLHSNQTLSQQPQQHI